MHMLTPVRGWLGSLGHGFEVRSTSLPGIGCQAVCLAKTNTNWAVLEISPEEQAILMFPAHLNVISSYLHFLHSQLRMEAWAFCRLSFPDFTDLTVSNHRLKVGWPLLSVKSASGEAGHGFSPVQCDV